MEDELLQITSVTLNGIDFPTFDPSTRTLNIAANQGGKFKVTFKSTPKTYTSVASLQNDKINVFPNPTSGLIHVKGLKNAGKISIVDLSGKVILEKQVPGNDMPSVDLTTLNPGIYFVVLHQNTGIKTIKKVVKQ
jgi:hypothetical protein